MDLRMVRGARHARSASGGMAQSAARKELTFAIALNMESRS